VQGLHVGYSLLAQGANVMVTSIREQDSASITAIDPSCSQLPSVCSDRLVSFNNEAKGRSGGWRQG
jgi:hypothetical protein